jgi:hypothetical protein
MLFPTFLFHNPGPIRHRWLVAYVLTMPALEVGHPIAKLILMKTNDRLLHNGILQLHFLLQTLY